MPEGFSDKGSVGARPGSGAIVPFSSEPQQHRNVPLWVGLVCCVAGGACLAMLPTMACVLAVAYGAAVAFDQGSPRARVLACAGTLAATGVATFLASPDGTGTSLVLAALALAMAGLAKVGRLTPGSRCLLVVGTALALLLIDGLVAHAAGTSLSQVVSATVDAYESSLAGQTAEAIAQAEALRSAVELMWPSTYVVVATCELVCAHVGLWLASRNGVPGIRLEPFEGFDLPFWVLVALAVDVTALVADATVQAWPDLANQVALNALLALRVALAFQGFAVLVWFLRKRQVGAGGRAALLVLAFVLEVQLVIMTIVGLLDMWCNYRRLPRGRGKVTVQGPADNESAHAD